MFELRPLSEENTGTWLAKFDCSILVAAGVKRADRIEDFFSLIAYEARHLVWIQCSRLEVLGLTE